MSIICWKCHKPTTVVAGFHPAASVDEHLITCDNELALSKAAELLRATGHAVIAQLIKPRESRSIRTTYLSNGCQHCDALQSNFFVFHKELMEVLPVSGLDGLERLTDADIPIEEWARLRANWETGRN